jgi:hypothetical protein
MIASAEAIARTGLEEGFAGFESETIRGGQPGRFISIDVTGAQELWLFVTGSPDVKWGVADWANARLVRKDGAVDLLAGARNFKAVTGRYETNLTLRSGLYQKMRLGEREFDSGLHVQANSAVFVPLDREDEKFEAWIGVDAWAGTNGTVRFSVLGARAAARKRLWEFVARDFSEELPRRQIAWEREDRIYEREWKPGDFAALAQRYAMASRRVPPLAEAAAKLAANTYDATQLAPRNWRKCVNSTIARVNWMPHGRTRALSMWKPSGSRLMISRRRSRRSIPGSSPPALPLWNGN